MISKEEVQHIAKLARLGLTDQEIEKYQKELSLILDYFEKLKEVNISGIEPTSHSIKVENVLRKDESKGKGSSRKLIESFPDRKEDYLKVKSILK
ncbi:MAG: asparaginyl/glutamyl-tRNA amidotransferase subunit C [Candidatus Nealsonbacteria bacterium RBG_13_38_11]|uniref:Aspartyl/glutamyl-tRNA(Asn/Gln) amidotransferase subunit C n=1 Tax=Candidatus Nealsonbacteria bacterium RBG_13_38_11 TaxID=1801662 RepID=A0A1G2E1U6_9BACT|nr:MAG: asparaginyl/glutamyl-tRNA amidotransferase subunit C [Candidatus Nealsonbacteria bacterium RBG_13_38_11]